MEKYKKGEIAKMILSTLLVVGVLVIVSAAPGITRAAPLLKYFKPKTASERKRINKSLFRLEKQGYIKRRSGGEDIFTLTNEGERKALRYKIDAMRIARQKKWDKKWRIVMFDVPEDQKQARRAINLALKKLGCVQYQKSVFITPFPCKEEIDFVGRAFGVREHVRLILAENIEGQDILKNNFSL